MGGQSELIRCPADILSPGQLVANLCSAENFMLSWSTMCSADHCKVVLSDLRSAMIECWPLCLSGEGEPDQSQFFSQFIAKKTLFNSFVEYRTKPLHRKMFGSIARLCSWRKSFTKTLSSL